MFYQFLNFHDLTQAKIHVSETRMTQTMSKLPGIDGFDVKRRLPACWVSQVVVAGAGPV